MPNLKYNKLFNPTIMQDFRSNDEDDPAEQSRGGDRRDGKLYFYTDNIVLAINVALATQRPLLIEGPSGSGKSSLALNVARVLKRRYYDFVVTSRTKSQDILWKFDAVKRLRDAQIHSQSATIHNEHATLSEKNYIDPSVLWWAYNAKVAKTYGLSDSERGDICNYPIGGFNQDEFEASVILIDEIDKADPDFANNLLVALGSREFRISETGEVITYDKSIESPLVLITTNKERLLPPAFLRRCVLLRIGYRGKADLVRIAIQSEHHLDENDPEYEALRVKYGEIYEQLTEIKQALPHENFNGVSIAEFLDVVRAYNKLIVGFTDDEQRQVLNMIIDIILKNRPQEKMEY